MPALVPIRFGSAPEGTPKRPLILGSTAPSPPTPPLPGLGAWYDSSVFSSLTLVSSTITGVADLTGNGNNLTTSPDSNLTTPAPVYDATGFNSLPTLVFTSGPSNVHTTAPIVKTGFSMGTGDELTFFLVGSVSALTDNGTRFISYGTGGSHDYDNPGSWSLGFNPTAAALFRNFVGASKNIGYDTPAILIGTIDAGGNMTLYLDGVASAPVTSGGNWVNGGLFGLGGGVYDFDTTLTGSISEVGVSPNFTGPVNVNTLYLSLKAKWNL